MPPLSDHHDAGLPSDRLRDADAVTAKLMSELVRTTCRRYPSIGQAAKTARIERLIGSQAWTDAALALIDLELPQWQLRRMAYDEGEWHCALSRAREIPEWLDQSIETRHADLPLAILSAYLDAQYISARRGAGPASPPCRATPTLSTRRSAAIISRKRRTKIPVGASSLGASIVVEY